MLVLAGAVTFIAVYGAFLALKPARFGEIGTDGVIIINDRPVKLPVGPVLSFIAVLLAAMVALGTAVGLHERVADHRALVARQDVAAQPAP